MHSELFASRSRGGRERTGRRSCDQTVVREASFGAEVRGEAVLLRAPASRENVY